jgi:recombination protein RecR
MKDYDALPLIKLFEHFERLPGIGRKTARRLAYSILGMDKKLVKDFADCMLAAKESIHYCKLCCNFTDKEVCSICSDPTRDKSTICVVEEPKDVRAFERSREYNSLYHVIHGVISPLNGIGPDSLHIKELISRLSSGEANEVIMATNPTVEGEATSLYISKLLKPMGVKVSRIAYGIPFGAMLEYTDEQTLGRAINDRVEM